MYNEKVHTAELEKRRFRRRLSIYLALFISIAGFLGGAVMFFGESFKFQEIKIIGVSPVLVEDLKKVLINEAKQVYGANWLGYRHMALWLGDELISADPRLSGSQLKKDIFKRILTVAAPVHERAIIWCSDFCYWLDKSGRVLEKAPSAEGELVPTVFAVGGGEAAGGQPVLPIESFNNLVSFFNLLKSTGLKNFRFHVDRSEQELLAEQKGLASIYVNLRYKPDFIEGPLRRIMQSPGLSKLSYLDFRTQNRVYFR